MAIKKSFILYTDQLSVLDDLTVEQCAELFMAIKAYQNDIEIELSPIIKIAFSPFRNQFIRDSKKYSQTVEKRREAGRLGGYQKQQNLANASKCKQTIANLPDNVNVNVNGNDNVTGNDKEKRRRFTPPLLKELKTYISEKQLSINSDDFINFYESKNWMVGKNKMKDWKASARGWHSRNNNGGSNGKRDTRNQAERTFDAICNLPDD